MKAQVIFAERAALKDYLTAFKTVPSLLQDRIDIASERISANVYAREWTNAEDILYRSANEEFYFSYAGATIPRGCLEIWLARLRRDDRAMETRFATARDLLYRIPKRTPMMQSF